MTAFPKRYADFVQRLRVPFGFVLVIAFGLLARPTLASLAWGAPLCLLGLWLRGWAAGCLRKNERLATGGPYAWLRNPLYLGTLLVAAGVVVAAQHPLLAVLAAAFFVLVYWPVMDQEEQHLRKLFPDYAGYARRVPKLLPRRPAARAPGGFSWAVYRRNQEYQAALGFAAGFAFLLWRALA